MADNIQFGEPPQDQAVSTNSVSKNWWNTVWGYTSISVIFCSLFVAFIIASLIVLSLIPLYLSRKELNGIDITGSSSTFNVIYKTDVTDGSSLTITDLKTLSEEMSKQVHIKNVIVNNAKFVSQSATNTKKKRQAAKINNFQYENDKDIIGDLLSMSLTIKNTEGCISPDCNQIFISMAKNNIDTIYNKISLNIKFTDGETRNVQLTFLSYEQPLTGQSTSLTSQSTTKTTTTTKSTSTSTSTTTTVQSTLVSTTQPIITQCQSFASMKDVPNKLKRSPMETERPKLKMQSASNTIGNRALLKNAYLVEFAPNAHVKNHFETIAKSLKASHGIHESTIKQRHIIESSLFSGISFLLPDDHSTDALEMIKEAIAIYPIYIVSAPKPIQNDISFNILDSDNVDYINSHGLTGVTQVHNEFNNFGKGVRVAVIDKGIYYLHPALGGCFGTGCKVAFGYDLVGDEYGTSDYIEVPDNDPLDNCSADSHGTHVAGIIGANTTGINATSFISDIPFIGVAPQVTLGAYRVFGCNGGSTTDTMTKAIYRAYDDNADIITMSIADDQPYPETSDVIAIQRVVDAGVYFTAAMVNDGDGGLQTSGNPGNAPNAMTIGSVDNTIVVRSVIITPNGSTIFYWAGVAFGGWVSIVNSTIVVNDPNMGPNDGCSGPSKSVSGAVVLFYVRVEDSCDANTRCDLAAAAGATGCLLYNVGLTRGASNIPSGSISLADALSIIATVTANPSAVYTFTNLVGLTSSDTGGTPSSFSSWGLTGDLWLKPQICGIGGNVYSTVSLFTTQLQHLAQAYSSMSGTSMATPYSAGALALFLASIGNPAPNTTTGFAANGICRPQFSVATNIFQSTAMPMNIYNSSLLATTAKQGAGLINAYQALTTTTIFSPSQLSLNDTVRKATSYTVNLWNIGNQAGVYKITYNGSALVTAKDPNQDQLLNTPLYSADYAVVDIQPTDFALNPGESREITLQFQVPAAANPTLLPIYSGFIYATNMINGKVVHLSYAGMVGNYGDARIIVRDFSSTYTTGVYDLNFNYVLNETLPTLNVTNQYQITIVTVWSTRLLFVEVVSTQDDGLSGFNSSYGLLYSTTNNGTLYFPNLARSVGAGAGVIFATYKSFNWNGSVCPKMLGGNCTQSQITTVPPGQYKIRFSALKHFGNVTNPADFDIYRTPSFNLVY